MTTTTLPLALPVELIHNILQLVPTLLFRHTTADPLSESHRMSIAQPARVACLVLPTSPSIRIPKHLASLARFAGGPHHTDWNALLHNNQTCAKSAIAFLIQWYKWTDRNDAHMFAAFDCALIANRVDVLSLWWEPTAASLLPFRTGLDPQPALPFALAVRSDALEAILQVHNHLMDNCVPPLDMADLFDHVFNPSLTGTDLVPLVRDYPTDSRQYRFFMDWVGRFNYLTYKMGDVVLFASEFGRGDVIDALLEQNDVSFLWNSLEDWEVQRVGTVAVENEHWDVLKRWLEAGYGFALILNQ